MIKDIKILIIFCLFSINLFGQQKIDTVGFTLHCSENEIEVEENLNQQLDSIYETLHFNDTTLHTILTQVVVFGHTDAKGSNKQNQELSLKRANYVYYVVRKNGNRSNDIITGFGESYPIADNKTEENRSKNRRVEVTLVYYQLKKELPKKSPPGSDTVIVFEDSTILLINKTDYALIKNNLIYSRKSDLFSLFNDLPTNNSNDLFYKFDAIHFTWADSSRCLSHEVTLSVKIPNEIVKESAKEIKAYCKKFKGQMVRLTKHKDNCWYIDIITNCPWTSGCAGFHGNNKDKGKFKKVKYVSKKGYLMLGAFYDSGGMFAYKKSDLPVKKIKFKTHCPGRLPVVSIVAIHKKNLDTIYYASGTEQQITYRRRCFNCVDKDTVVKNIIGIKIHKRLLRRKYVFKPKDYEHKLNRKVNHEKK